MIVATEETRELSDETAERERALRSAVWRAVLSATTSAEKKLQEECFENLAEVVLDLSDSREDGRIDLSLENLEETIGDMMTMFDGVEEDVPGQLARDMVDELQVEQARIDEEEDLEGCCELCERDMKLTRHHVIPRAVHKEYRKKGYTIAQLSTTINLCRACHSAIHRFISEKELAANYRSAETLYEHEQVRRFVDWNAKQKIRMK